MPVSRAYRRTAVLCPSFVLEVSMELIINRLYDLNVHDPVGIVADCVDSGRLQWLIDYIKVREALYKAEVETYVR